MIDSSNGTHNFTLIIQATSITYCISFTCIYTVHYHEQAHLAIYFPKQDYQELFLGTRTSPEISTPNQHHMYMLP